MARRNIEEEGVIETGVVQEPTNELSQREMLWQQFLKNYKVNNPVKYASKEANGEFKVIPPSFLGKVRNVKGKDLIY